MKRSKGISLALCAIIVVSLVCVAFASTVFPRQAFDYGLWREKAGYGGCQYDTYQNSIRIKSYSENPYGNNWTVGWEVTTSAFGFWVGNSITFDMQEESGSQEGWFYISNRYSTTVDPYSFGDRYDFWLRINVDQHTNYTICQMRDWSDGIYKIFDSTDAKYMNGTWEIYIDHYTADPIDSKIVFYFTPKGVQSQAELVKTWDDGYCDIWLWLWDYDAGHTGYMYVGSSNCGTTTGWRIFSNVILGKRIL